MKVYFVFILSLLSCYSIAQGTDVWLHPNKGQWEDLVDYKVDLQAGDMFINKDGFAYVFIDLPSHSEEDHSHEHSENGLYKTHAVKTTFLNHQHSQFIQEGEISRFYRNYLIGNTQKHVAKVHSVSQIRSKDYYDKIDLVVIGGEQSLKYQFELKPTATAGLIQMKIEGADKNYIDSNGVLNMVTSLGVIKELHPVAWYTDSHKKIPVNFKLEGNILSYEFPNGYDHTKAITIDPYLVFSSFTGSTSDNWGMTATPGPNGETYGGGISFGTGYPIIAGAYDPSHNGGIANNNIPGFDIAISKFSDDGSQLLFSTFVGGAANELPESMITNTNGDLFVLGITSSTDFPTTNGAFDQSFNGGNLEIHNSLRFDASDIVVYKLSADGTTMLHSTYMGGIGNDGLNASSLAYNYGDEYRGELALDGAQNVYVASHTLSDNFPVTDGSTLSGSQDIIAFKLDNTFSTLLWSKYLGGSGDDSGNSITVSNNGEVYIAGGTKSPDFTMNGHQATYGGAEDGYVVHLDPSSGATLQGSFIGSSGLDQTYFVRTDIDDEVYIYGQTNSGLPMTPGKYGVANSGQFIRKYDADLLTMQWTTLIGAGTSQPEISPTAFLISDCYDIFIAGWGGYTNYSNSNAAFSTTNGFPVTSDAYQPNTNGSNFYVAIYSQDMGALVYGSFMGGAASSYNHVDGGTSRFDKAGAIYHAVCAACGGADNGFTSTPGAWSTTNPSPNCNMAVWKFQLGIPYSLSPNATICEGESYQLEASGGINYQWSPSSTLSNPFIHNPIATPNETTVYYVNMEFNEGCAIDDSVIVTVVGQPDAEIEPIDPICFGTSTNAIGAGGGTYNWYPAEIITSPNSSTTLVSPETSQYVYLTVANECFTNTDSTYIEVIPLPDIIVPSDTIICLNDILMLTVNGGISNVSWTPDPTLTVVSQFSANVSPTTETTYYVSGQDEYGCSDQDSIIVAVIMPPILTITADTSVCLGESVGLSITGGDSYSWSPSATLQNPMSSTPIATPSTPTMYTVDVTYGQGCTTQDQVFVDIDYLPTPNLPEEVYVCRDQPTTLTATGTDVDSYSWSPATFLNTTNGPSVISTPTNDITYTLGFTNHCGTVYEQLPVVVQWATVEAFNDTIVCPGSPVPLYATGGIIYNWQPANLISGQYTSQVEVVTYEPTPIIVTGTDANGCIDRDTVYIDLFPQPHIYASADVYAFLGDEIQLTATTSDEGVITWSPSEYLSCVNCLNPVANPDQEYTYIVSIVDENNCRAQDAVTIYYQPLIYVPNTFTPDGNETNNVFKVEGGNVNSFKMLIFNRWGELVYTLTSLEDYWDGTFKGEMCQDGTYVWKMTYTDIDDNEFIQTGHINLLR